MTENDFELVRGSGNVFRDFNDPHADLKQAKATLAARIIAVLDERPLSCAQSRYPDRVCRSRFLQNPQRRPGPLYLGSAHQDACRFGRQHTGNGSCRFRIVWKKGMTSSYWLCCAPLSNRGSSPRPPGGWCAPRDLVPVLLGRRQSSAVHTERRSRAAGYAAQRDTSGETRLSGGSGISLWTLPRGSGAFFCQTEAQKNFCQKIYCQKYFCRLS